MTTTYYHLYGEEVKPVAQAPRQPWKPPAGAITATPATTGKPAISAVTTAELAEWLETATEDDIMTAIMMEETADKPRAVILKRLRKAAQLTN